jgi:hypothetical protein
MNEKEYKQLKKEYKDSTEPSSGYWLCKIPSSGEVYFGQKAEIVYGIYSENQKGFEQAIERTAVPMPKHCPECKQVVA